MDESRQVATTYGYDDASNLLTKTSPNSFGINYTVTFTYDGMNRVKTKTLSTGGLWNYSYDTGTNGKGKLVSVVKSGSTDGYYYDGYDAMGRVSASHQITTTTQSGAQSYSMSYAYVRQGGVRHEILTFASSGIYSCGPWQGNRESK